MRIFLSLILSLCCAPTFAGEVGISGALSHLADNLTKTYQTKSSSSEKTRMAMLTFRSDKELEKRRVGFAVSELLTHSLAKKPDFVMLERMELNKVLGELNLNASGAIDTVDAVQVGKLTGVDILVMGSVEKIGKNYHVNARMVRVETGEVFATAYEELPGRLFEEEAKDYLLAPESQRIGIYLLYNWRSNRNNLGDQYATSPCGAECFKPTSFAMGLPGFGIRYYLKRNWLLDFATMSTGGRQPVVGKEISARVGDIYLRTVAFRGLASAIVKISDKSSLYVGGGFANYTLSSGRNKKYIVPVISGRYEYFPQARVGLSLSIGYEFLHKTITRHSYCCGMNEKRAKLDSLYIEPTVAIYF